MAELVGSDPSNRSAWEYEGALLLLEKDLEQFRDFLENRTPASCLDTLPLHFQEAALLLTDGEDLSAAIQIDPKVRERFNEYKAAGGQLQPQELFKRFGNTFWYYNQFFKQGK